MMLDKPWTAAAAFAVIAAAMGGSACAMNSTSETRLACSVAGASELPAQIGGADGVCAAIERAVVPALRDSGIASSAVAIAVQVKSASRVSAVATLNGSALPEQNVASSDRTLNAGSIDMLARGLAAQLSAARQ